MGAEDGARTVAQAAKHTAARFRIVGRVQGVHFRASTREQAQRLGLRGHALNLRDGSVDVVAAGSAEAVEALAAWLMQGPPTARVEGVERQEIAADGIGAGISAGTGFAIG